MKAVPAPGPYVVGSVEEFRMAPKDGCHTMLHKGAEICGANVWHP
jgi:hypothetical protein